MAVGRDVLEEMELKGIAPTRALLLGMLASAHATKVPEHLGVAVYLFDRARALADGCSGSTGVPAHHASLT